MGANFDGPPGALSGTTVNSMDGTTLVFAERQPFPSRQAIAMGIKASAAFLPVNMCVYAQRYLTTH
jgi:hypothetical protein